MTYSLIAVDKNHEFMVVATATKTPAVGESVPAILPGVGGVVSQSFTNPELRKLSLARLAEGLSPEDAVASALASDTQPELRQLAVMNSLGKSATHTGSGCTEVTGQYSAGDFVCIGNLLANDSVIPKMHVAWPGAADLPSLVGAALASMQAAEAAGGDSRGKQSAALLVASMGEDARMLAELRVDDSADPLGELAQLTSEWLATAPSA